MSRLSLAQTLPAELLTRIFGWLVEIRSIEIPGARMASYHSLIEWPNTANIPDLHRVCLVCRGWQRAAQSMLFRSVRAFDADPELLGATLEARPDLAQAVQAVDLGMPSINEFGCIDPDSWEYTWEPFVGCRNIRHVALSCVPLASRERLFDFLAPLNLESLVTDASDWWVQDEPDMSILCVDDLAQLAKKPTLRHLASIWTPYPLDFDPPLRLPLTSSSLLTSLSLSISEENEVGVIQLLALSAASLKRLDVYTRRALTYANFGAALETCTVLKEMRLSYLATGRDPFDDKWLLKILTEMTSLTMLAVECDVVHPLVILQAPPSLELLEYDWYGADLPSFLGELSADFESSSPPFSTFRLIVSAYLDTDEEEERANHELKELRRVCKSRDVDVEFYFDKGPSDFPERTCISFFWCAGPPLLLPGMLTTVLRRSCAS